MLVGGGCAHYQSMPLDETAVEKGVAGPTNDVLCIEAGELRHQLLAPITFDPQRGLSPDEIAVIAVLANPTLRGERDQRGIAAAQLLQAGLLPNPQLTAGLEFPYNTDPPDDFTAYSAGLEWEVTALIAREQKRRSAASAAAAVNLDVAWKEWQVAQEARTAAYNVLALEGQLKAARDANAQLMDNLKVVQNAVDRHELTLLDLAAAEASAQDAQGVVLGQEKDLAHERLMLSRAIGCPSDRPIRLRDNASLPSKLTAPAAEELSAGLETRRLDLQALRRGYDSQDATLRAAILGQFPRLSLGGGAARDTSNVRTLTLGVTLDLPLFDRNQAVIATEKATRQKLFDEFAARVFEARSDIAIAISDIRSINAQIAAGDEAISGLEKLVQTHDAALKRGNIEVLSVYTARNALLQKRLGVLALKQQLMTSWIALELAAGRYLPMDPPATQESHP